MRFLDPLIRIYFKDRGNNNSIIEWKAYLDDIAHNYAYEEKTLPFASGLPEDGNIATIARVLQSIKISFDVYAEDREEVFYNYSKLKQMLAAMKPRGGSTSGGYFRNSLNTTGLVSVKFDGLIPLKTFQEIHVTAFSYAINKDLGFIAMPTKTYEKFYTPADNTLYPLGFKINFEGRIITVKPDTGLPPTSGLDGGPEGEGDDAPDAAADVENTAPQTQASGILKGAKEAVPGTISALTLFFQAANGGTSLTTTQEDAVNRIARQMNQAIARSPGSFTFTGSGDGIAADAAYASSIATWKASATAILAKVK